MRGAWMPSDLAVHTFPPMWSRPPAPSGSLYFAYQANAPAYSSRFPPIYSRVLHLAISFPDQKPAAAAQAADSLSSIIVLCAPEKVKPLIPGLIARMTAWITDWITA